MPRLPLWTSLSPARVEKGDAEISRPLTLKDGGLSVPLAPGKMLISSRAQRMMEQGLLVPSLLSSLPSSFFHFFFPNIWEM